MQKYLIILSFILSTTISCSPVRLVSTGKTPPQEMEAFKTYAFAQLSKRVEVNRANSESVEAYIRQSFIREMEQKGYQLVEVDQNPDLLVDLWMNLVNYQREETSGTRYSGGRYFYNSYRYGYGLNSDRSELETNANMKVDISLTFADAGNKRRLGGGKAETNLSRKAKKSAERLDTAVDLLLESLLSPVH